MPVNKLCIAAKGIIRDADTNTITIFSVLERITPAGVPFIFQDMAVLAVWRREPGDAARVDFQFRVLNNAHVLHAGPIRADFQALETTRTMITLSALVIGEPGLLSFVFERNGAEAARYDIEIAPPQPQIAAQPAGAPQPQPAGG